METQPFFMPIGNEASNNLFRIANRTKLLEDLYKNASTQCLGDFDINDWDGLSLSDLEKIRDQIIEEGYTEDCLHEDIIYPREKDALETLDQIESFLSTLSGNFPSSSICGKKLYLENLILANGTNSHNLLFDIIIEPYISWLYNLLNRCRSAQRGIKNLQSLVREQYYRPGGTFTQKAAPRFYDMASQHQINRL